MNINFANLLVGWSTGYSYATAKNKEDEIKQGENYYLAVLPLIMEFAQLAGLISKINETLPAYPFKRGVTVLCNIAPFSYIPTAAFFAAVKQGDYEKLAEVYHQSEYAYIPLPEKLNGHTVSFFSFFAEHSGNIMQVAMIVGSIWLITLGNVRFGGALLAALAYQSLDQIGLIPRRISLWMEIHMPTITFLGLLIGGSLVVRIFSACFLVTYIPYLNTYLHQKVDALFRYYFPVPGPSLAEIEAPLVKPKEMTFDEINEILDADAFSWDINPAHLSKAAVDLDKFPIDKDFTKFLTLFNAIDWESKSDLILKKIKDDDRFIDFLLKKDSGISKEDLLENFDDFLAELASEEGVEPEKYALDWIRNQMEQLVDLLSGKQRVKGLQQDLDEAIEVCAVILPYLSSLEDEIELEDTLLKIAIEGGDYCARGIKRAANELLWGVLENDVEYSEDLKDPVANYEHKVIQALQNLRLRLIESLYQHIQNELKIPDAIAQDTHAFDFFRMYLSLGFFPLTKFERNQLGVSHILGWEVYADLRQSLYQAYMVEMDKAIEDVGTTEFGIYIANIINNNERLTSEEKEQLLEKFTENNDNQWTTTKTLDRFHRLLLIKLGVIGKFEFIDLSQYSLIEDSFPEEEFDWFSEEESIDLFFDEEAIDLFPDEEAIDLFPDEEAIDLFPTEKGDLPPVDESILEDLQVLGKT